VNRSDLQQLALDRIADAKALLKAKRWAGAYYLSGYAVECALKACIAKLTKAEDFPDKGVADRCWTHDLDRLVAAARLNAVRDAAYLADSELEDYWGIAKDWKETSRYGRTPRAMAEELYKAITDKNHGVLRWIKLHW
jgi:HEPN domain-containing protein